MSDFQDSSASTRRLSAFIICALASLFYVYEFFLRVSPGVVTRDLMYEFSMNAQTLGLVSALFYYGYTPMQIPAGLLLDRYGPRLLMSIFMGLCGLGALLFASTQSVFVLGLARFLIGFASSFAFVGALVLAGRWFPPKYFAFITGLIQFMGCMGAIFGETPVALLSHAVGWRTTLWWSGWFGILLAVFFWLVIRDEPQSDQREEADAHKKKAQQASHAWSEARRLCYVCRHPQTWVVAVCGFACWAPIVVFAALWGVPFLMADYHTTAAVASAAISVIWVGVALASPLVGWWSNAIKSRRIPLICCYVIGFVASLCVIYIPHPSWMWMNCFLFFLGGAAAAQAVTFGAVQDNMPPQVMGTAVGFNNMAVIFAGVAIQPLVGALLTFCWDGQYLHNVPYYSLLCYQKALFLVPLTSLLGLAMAFFMKETHCQPQYDAHAL